MSTGYTRQSSGLIVTGATIIASHFNNEYNQLASAFDNTIGHTHDGSATGTGAPIPVAGLNGLSLSSVGFVVCNGSSGFDEVTLTGSAGQITISNGTGTGGNPIFGIDPSYIGQTSITTLGTITSGTWQGTVLSPTYGGTGTNNGTKTIVLGGNFSTSGAFAATLTLTANTNVTLPTSGTLVGSADTGTVTNTMLAGSIAAAKLVGSDIATVGTVTSGTWQGTIINPTFGGTGVSSLSSITTLSGLTSVGTITSGAWNASAVPVTSGGTGLTTLTANNVILGNGTSTPTFVAPGTSGNLLTSNGTTWQSQAPAAVASMPTGAVIPYAGSSAPSGYVLCFGQSLLRASFAALFAVIGTTYGSADGTHFNVPDLRGNVVAGIDNMGGSAASRLTSTTMTPDGQTLGATGGSQTTTIGTTNLPAHNHTINISDSGHGHDVWQHNGNATTSSIGGITEGGAPNMVICGTIPVGGTNAYATTNGNGNLIINTNTTGITATSANTGSGTAIGTIQPTVTLNYIIKT